MGPATGETSRVISEFEEADPFKTKLDMTTTLTRHTRSTAPLVFSLLAVLLLLTSLRVTAAALPVPEAPQLSARGYILVDYSSGQILAEQGANDRLEPASITKLMTAYVVFTALREGAIKLDDQVLVSEKAWRMEGSRMFIEVGHRVPVEDLLRGMIIQSGNDASVALAEHVAGSEGAFSDLMNRHAQQLGLNGTHFVNSTGMPDPDHYTTARDIAVLTRALIRDFHEHYKLYSERKYTYAGITQYNRNKLLWQDDSVDGVKTGYTASAGYCLVTSANREGMRLISVVLGTKSERARARDSKALLNYGFRFYESHVLYQAGTELARARVWMGAENEMPLSLAEDLIVVIPRGKYQQMKATMEIDASITAPVAKGKALGKVVVMLEGAQLVETPLVASNEMEEGNLGQQLIDRALMMFE
jgi:D-alanyl-D-alanine carboxypeptidase (penicillin-binding protein 5/6)